MQQAVDGVKEQLVANGVAEGFCAGAGDGGAEDDFPGEGFAGRGVVELEGEDVGGGGVVKILFVEFGHLGGGDDGDGELAEGGAEELVGGEDAAAECGDAVLRGFSADVQMKR
jgi:hypothetical protein